jgi:hypothetical protein
VDCTPEEGQRAGKATFEGRAEDGYVNNNITMTDVVLTSWVSIGVAR